MNNLQAKPSDPRMLVTSKGIGIPALKRRGKQYCGRFPYTNERQYQRFLLAIVRETYSAIQQTTNDLHFDADLVSVANAAFSKLVFVLAGKKPRLSDYVKPFAQKTSSFNNSEWQKTVKSVYGVSLVHHEPWLPGLMNAWTQVNVDLIESLTDQAVGKVKNIVITAAMNGTSAKEVTKQIKEAAGVSERRARFIGRDQIAKLNGNLTQNRQKQLGINSYVWRTAMDERVRMSHRANEGKVFKWSNPPPTTGHPGQDYQCRCYAEAIFPELEEFYAQENTYV